MSTDRYAESAAPALDTPEPTPATGLILPPGFVDAIDPATGQVVAVRVQEQPLPAPAAQVPATVPPPAQGASPLVGQVVVLGGIASLSMLAAGGAIYIACAGLHAAGPWFHDAADFLKHAAIFIVAAVVAAVVAVRKLKDAMTTTTGDGTVVTALFHKHTEVTIGKQSAGFWKGTVNNHVR